MDINSIKTEVEIFGSIAAAFVFICKAIAFLHQDKVSTTLLTYGDRQKYKLIESLALFVCFFLAFFVLGVGANSFGNAQIRDYLIHYALIEQKMQDEIGVYLVFLLLSALFSFRLWRKEKKRVLHKEYVKFSRYFCLCFLLFIVILLFIYESLGCLILEEKSLFFLFDSIISICVSFFLMTFLFILTFRNVDELAYLKYYDEKAKKYVYLFDCSEGLFTAGDKIQRSECACFYFVDKSKLADVTIIKAKMDDIIFWPRDLIKDVRKGNKVDQLDILQKLLEEKKEVLLDKDHNVIKEIRIAKREKNKVTYFVEGNDVAQILYVKGDRGMIKYDIYFC